MPITIWDEPFCQMEARVCPYPPMVLLEWVRSLQILSCSENSVSFSVSQVKFESLRSSEGHDLIRRRLFIKTQASTVGLLLSWSPG